MRRGRPRMRHDGAADGSSRIHPDGAPWIFLHEVTRSSLMKFANMSLGLPAGFYLVWMAGLLFGGLRASGAALAAPPESPARRIPGWLVLSGLIAFALVACRVRGSRRRRCSTQPPHWKRRRLSRNSLTSFTSRSGGIGRRAGFKIRFGQPSVGSSPTSGIGNPHGSHHKGSTTSKSQSDSSSHGPPKSSKEEDPSSFSQMLCGWLRVAPVGGATRP